MPRAPPDRTGVAGATRTGARTARRPGGAGSGSGRSARLRRGGRRTRSVPAPTRGLERRAGASRSGRRGAPARRRVKPPARGRGRRRPCDRRQSGGPFVEAVFGEPLPARPEPCAGRAASPSRQSRSRRIREEACWSDELEKDHLGRVGTTRSQLQDPRVATGTVGVARSDLLEQPVHDELVLTERSGRLTASVLIAALRERDQLLDLRLGRLRLGLGRLDPLVLDDLLGEVHQQRLTVRRVAAELVSLLLVADNESEGSRGLGVAQVETASLQRLDDLFDRLATEVRDRRELRLGLLQQLADGLDAGTLEAVVRADAKLELLDEDVVHRAAAATADRGCATAVAEACDTVAGAGLELLEALGVGEDRQRLGSDLRRLAPGR